MKYFWIILAIPVLLSAQDFEFELDPDAFPVEIDGWQPHQPWAGGNHPTTPEFCDIDADEDYDYFSGSQENLFWFFNNEGSSQTPDFVYKSAFFDSIYPICPGSAYESDMDFADIDTDGDFDAFLCNGCIGIATNQGTAIGRDFSSLPDTIFDQFGDKLWATNMAAVDIDADGDIDLFGGTYYSGELRFFENVGTPQSYQYSLVTEAWQSVQAPQGKADPCFADLDADGDLDLLVGTAAGTIYYYRNDGDSANPQMTYVTNSYLNIDVEEDASPELVDIDNDGDLDLFVGRSPYGGQSVTQGDVFFYENVGSPQEAIFQLITTNYMTWDCGHHSKPRLVDIDADGDPDLFSSIGDRLTFYNNQGTVSDPAYVWETDNFQNVIVFGLTPWFCDIDADGDYDLLAGESAIPGPPGLHLYLNRGTPQRPDFVFVTDDLVPGVFTTGSVILSPWTADIDADGDQDLFVSAGTVYYFENVGSASSFDFQFVTSGWQNVGYITGPYWGCFYDIDDDLDHDLFINSEDYYWNPWEKNLLFYRNVGTPQNPIMQLENEDLFPDLMIWQASPFLLDMDQDGDGDMFVGDTWGGIRYFENVTDTSSTPPYQKCPYPCIKISFGPNPANPVTWVTFNLPYPQKATLAVYNLLGQKVATLAQGLQPPGVRTVYWNSSQVSSGVYLIEMETEMGSTVKRLTVLK